MKDTKPDFGRCAEQWDRLGATDPYWAVLTRPDARHGRWDLDEFFATGRTEIAEVLARVASLGLSVRTGRALDFGCGVGRLSRALALTFREVVGVDISRPMLDEARRANGTLYANIRFTLNERPDLGLFEDSHFDFIYSNIVLQHIPRELQAGLVRELARLLAPGGVLVFQTPSGLDFRRPTAFMIAALPTPLLNILRRARHGRDGVMEMHCLPTDEVKSALASHGVDLVAADRNQAAGPAFLSYRYVARKA
jgi:2-polyprenyl-3-methyl-5-hydroxy-6-metoxy-1,4-benzoquinol methylase